MRRSERDFHPSFKRCQYEHVWDKEFQHYRQCYAAATHDDRTRCSWHNKNSLAYAAQQEKEKLRLAREREIKIRLYGVAQGIVDALKSQAWMWQSTSWHHKDCAIFDEGPCDHHWCSTFSDLLIQWDRELVG